MRMRPDGFLALTDAMIFIAVILIAASVTASCCSEQSDRWDAGDVMDTMVLTELRMSDLSEDGDGSMVRLTDMLAMEVLNGRGGASEYAEGLLDRACAGRAYILELRFMDSSLALGGDHDAAVPYAHRDVLVSTGGTLEIDLRMMRS